MVLTYIIALPSTVQFTKHRHYFEPHHPYMRWYIYFMHNQRECK